MSDPVLLPSINPSISPLVASKLRDLVAQLDAAAARAADIAAGGGGGVMGALSGWFQSWANTDSAASSVGSVAHSQANLAASIRYRVGQLTSDAEGMALLREAESSHWADLGDLEQVAKSLTLGGAAATVGADTARDLGNAAVAVGGGVLGALKLAPWVLLLAAGAVLFLWGRKRLAS